MSVFKELKPIQSNNAYMDVLLGGVILPVPPRAMKIKQSMKIDEIEIPGRSGKIKQPIGYEDSEITLTLEIPATYENGRIKEKAPDRFKAIQNLFRSSKDAKPQAVDIASTLTEAIGITQVLIKSVDIADSTMDLVTVSLTLTEYESIEVQLTKQAQEMEVKAEAEAKGEEAIAGDERLNEILGSPENDYLSRQYEAGKADAMGGGFEGETPGEDTD
ncbi:MAG: hypothetical protein ACE5D1_08210 [Fidelibacterota bacterium]